MNQIKAFDVFHSRIKLIGTLKIMSGLHVGASRDLGISASDLPVIKDFSGLPFIPGSSLKGVLRSNLESWIRTFNHDLACDPTDDDNRCIPSKMKQMIVSPDSKQEIIKEFGGVDNIFLEQSCLICRLFGSPWVASKVHIVDMKVEENWKQELLMVRDGVVIERETETAKPKGKYDFEAVPAGASFRLEILVENPEAYEMGLLMLGIEMLNQGLASLGGDVSRGLGRIKIDIEDIYELTQKNLLDWLQTADKPPEQEHNEPMEQDEPPATTDNDVPQQMGDIHKALIDCLKDAGTSGLKHEELTKAMQDKGITRDKLISEGFGSKKISPWKPLFDKAIKNRMIVNVDEKFYLPNTVPQNPPESITQESDDSKVKQEKQKEIQEKIKTWKDSLRNKLQKDEIEKELDHWSRFRKKLNKEETSNVQSSI